MTKDQVDALAKLFACLYDRWQDEHEYEDFAAYRAAFASKLPEGATVKTFTSRPFRSDVLAGDERFVFKATARDVTVHVLKDART